MGPPTGSKGSNWLRRRSTSGHGWAGADVGKDQLPEWVARDIIEHVRHATGGRRQGRTRRMRPKADDDAGTGSGGHLEGSYGPEMQRRTRHVTNTLGSRDAVVVEVGLLIFLFL